MAGVTQGLRGHLVSAPDSWLLFSVCLLPGLGNSLLEGSDGLSTHPGMNSFINP
jgi:hypothetical protein